MKSNQDNFSDEEINLLNYWEVIWRWKFLILMLVLLITLGTAVSSMYKTDIYQATAIISPGNEEKGGGISFLSQQFGSLPGISIPPSASTSEIINLLKSYMIREKIIKKYNLIPVLFPEIRNSGPQDENKKKPSAKIPTMWDALRKLNSVINVNNNTKDNTISVSAEFQDPETTVKLVNYLLETLTEYMSSEAKRVAITKRRFLEEQLKTTSDPMIRQKISNLISQQIETALMAEIQEDFIFKIIDPPRVPDKKIGPERNKTIILNIVASLFIGIVLAFIFEYIKNLKRKTR